MLLKLLVIYYLIASSFAWLPQRCSNLRPTRSLHTKDPEKVLAVGNRNRRATETNAPVVVNIDDAATAQHNTTEKTYKGYQFLGVPIKIRNKNGECFPLSFEALVPFNCVFHTYNPELISSVLCGGITCELSFKVSETASYTVTEGQKWAVMLSSKLGIEKVFEIGGEITKESSYECTYSESRTKEREVRCGQPSLSAGTLRLYNVKTDMKCDFGKTEYINEARDNKASVIISTEGFKDDLEQLSVKRHTEVQHCRDKKLMMLNTDNITENLLRKITQKAPLFNRYTDLIQVLDDDWLMVIYYKKMSPVDTYRSIIPFTSPAGNAVQQYACLWYPL